MIDTSFILEEIKFLISVIEVCTFKGTHIEIIYTVMSKLKQIEIETKEEIEKQKNE